MIRIAPGMIGSVFGYFDWVGYHIIALVVEYQFLQHYKAHNNLYPQVFISDITPAVARS